MQNNNPLSPHLQIYKWHISSLLSITHRVVGVINFFAFIVHLAWDAGFGFDLKVAKISGVFTLIGSFILTILFYLAGRNFF